MRVVHKFEFEAKSGVQIINIPIAFKILRVDSQHNIPCMWAEVETSFDLTERQFHLFCTGEKIPGHMSYAGTCLLDDGSYVLHLYYC